MTIPNRTVSIKSVFASTANTTIPNPPATGVSYRNTGTTAAEIGEGWAFKDVVDSAKFNQAMYEYTTICQQVEKYGFLPWSANTDYPAQGCALGSDGKIYQAKQASGPSTSAVDPVTDTNHTYWDLFYYANVTANRALVSNASGKMAASAVTAAELGYLSGVTSAIQTQINNKAADNAVVHIAGVETITGNKTASGQWGFINSVYIYPTGSAGITVQNTEISKGTPPTSQQGNIAARFLFNDKNGNTNTYRLGEFNLYYSTSGISAALMMAYRPVSGVSTAASIGVYYPPTGSPYTQAPTPTTLSDSTLNSKQIVTTGYLDGSSSSVVHKSGNETIAGTKTFNSSPVLPTPTTSDNSTKAATTAYVKSQGYASDSAVVKLTSNQTIGGTKTFSNTIVGSINGNAATVTNGVYTTGNQTIGGTKTFSATAYGQASDAANSFLTTKSHGNNYVEFGNGYILQKGTFTYASSSGTVDVSLDKTMRTTDYAVTVMMEGTLRNDMGAVTAKATNKFTFKSNQYSSTGTAMYIVFGK